MLTTGILRRKAEEANRSNAGTGKESSLIAYLSQPVRGKVVSGTTE
ncbi:MAG: hypothetical protein M3297_15375 [Thermoproteota archaeon]|nr:hypothetical protein [Thermoproteota archaeon]